ncbi:MAG: hypothetical protein BGO21_22010 [Dyadobacter sp. 50-39]|uniref:hypothetical protein n=1 Tax=Dyadobacter sp. 50-39 TaxID=1895756 RepID=UPI00095B2F9D|nr:hypothetical protein [Dyadobacter sp. 50-39]OJV19740.1 MAG: hypothetical protein BGO21_22010 [Dyadobacter sp. 50-39]
MVETLHATQTPFERSRSKRVEKAYAILEVVKSSGSYSSKHELESVNGLEQELEDYEQVSQRYFDVVNQYIQASIDRKNLFKGRKHSIKETAYAIKLSVSANIKNDRTHRNDVKAIYALILAQNPLPAPYDFAKPSLDKDISAYLQSYHILLVNFKELVEQVSIHGSMIEDQPYSIAHCQGLILEAETYDKQIGRLTQTIYSLYDERLGHFDLIKERCNSIWNRSRFLTGSHDPDYLLINKYKMSLR